MFFVSSLHILYEEILNILGTLVIWGNFTKVTFALVEGLGNKLSCVSRIFLSLKILKLFFRSRDID